MSEHTTPVDTTKPATPQSFNSPLQMPQSFTMPEQFAQPTTFQQVAPASIDAPVNPLKQYFRKAAIYLKLPSGGKYSPGVIDMPPNGELPVYPMTALDEITARTPDALFNGVAVTELMRSCVPAIKDPSSISSVDLDAIMIAIKIATNGSVTEVEAVCPACKEEQKFDLDLTSLLGTLKSGNYDELFKINDLNIKFRALTFKEMTAVGLEQFELQKTIQNLIGLEESPQRDKLIDDTTRKIGIRTTEFISHAVESIGTPDCVVNDRKFISEFMLNCDRATFTAIKDHSFLLAKAGKLKPLNITCINPECKHEYEQDFVVNVSDFFD